MSDAFNRLPEDRRRQITDHARQLVRDSAVEMALVRWVAMLICEAGHQASRKADARIEALEAEVARLRAALTEIADRHIPDQPAGFGGDELEWAQRQHGSLRAIARAALNAPDPKAGG